MNQKNQENLYRLPKVDTLLRDPAMSSAIAEFGRDLVKASLRQTLGFFRQEALSGAPIADHDRIVTETMNQCRRLVQPSLRPVINATGIVIHTNLGRVPLGERILADLKEAVSSYCNLEFDLATGRRGHRSVHLRSLLCRVTGAESAVVVNNNAAALILVLSTLAAGREVIVSRGELIEIGGSFRIPDILATSGAKMVEVGTTNRTRIADYERAITDHTAILLKAHKSNYAITGFTEEPSLAELVDLGRRRSITVLFDIGSGLLCKPENLPLADEPDVKGALAQGVDLVTFSGDKLLGGPQAGIIAGRAEVIALLQKAPLMRALRVGKLTIAALASAVRAYLDDTRLNETLPLFAMLSAKPQALEQKARRFLECFSRHRIPAEIVPGIGRCGGGTLPALEIPSFALKLTCAAESQQKRSEFAGRLFHELLALDRPILGILRQGEIVFDVLTMDERDFGYVSEVAAAIIQRTAAP
jgi:L-seryl-tRNA(Ser) seleniumtransferase